MMPLRQTVNRLFSVLTALSVLLPACSDRADRAAAAETKDRTPLMMAFADLKWTGRKGMQFGVILGDPGTGAFTQIRRFLRGLTKGYTRIVANSGTSS